MIIAIPLKHQNDYTELKYCLRSIEQFMPGYEVVIIGNDLPEWITNVTVITLPDTMGRKQLTIKAKIIAALRYSDEILLMNDDTFLLAPVDLKTYYTHGTLMKVGESGARPLIKQLEVMGKPVKNFDGHYPLVYNRSFIEIAEYFSSDTIIKSMYCNFHEIPGVEIADCKIFNRISEDQFRNFVKGKPAFSTINQLSQPLIPIFDKLYARKSNFET